MLINHTNKHPVKDEMLLESYMEIHIVVLIKNVCNIIMMLAIPVLGRSLMFHVSRLTAVSKASTITTWRVQVIECNFLEHE